MIPLPEFPVFFEFSDWQCTKARTALLFHYCDGKCDFEGKFLNRLLRFSWEDGRDTSISKIG